MSDKKNKTTYSWGHDYNDTAWKIKVMNDAYAETVEEVMTHAREMSHGLEHAFQPSDMPKKKPSNIKVLPKLKGLNADQIEFIIDELNVANIMIPRRFIMNGTELTSRKEFALNLNGRTFVYYADKDEYKEIIEE